MSVLLREVFPDCPSRFGGVAITGMTADSRQVSPGMLFVALKGRTHDARGFIPQAVARGAVAVLAEEVEDYEECGVPVLGVPGLGHRQGELAGRFFGGPSQAMEVVAVTGTNGKTSTAQLLAHACDALGLRAGVLGTLGNGLVGTLEPSTHTTLDPIRLQASLAAFRDAGARVVAMEASSHGLEQGRLNGTRIHTAIFTNLTRDHLDYHGDMESYRDAKGLLFRWPGLQTAILNSDDPVCPHYRSLLAEGVRCWTYSQHPGSMADFSASGVELTLQGLTLTLRTPEGECRVATRLLGRFNVSNLLAVMAGLMSLGVPLKAAARVLETVPPVRGRMECYSAGGVTAVVDYAHTPDAMEKVLHTLREHVTGRLWCVFGCGGDRDAGKRPVMGGIAAALADRVIVTSDNPRREDPARILADILSGIPDSARDRVQVSPDRREAIALALAGAVPGDMVLLAGKGHEDYQEIAGVRYAFDDAGEVRRCLGLGSGPDQGDGNAI